MGRCTGHPRRARPIAPLPADASHVSGIATTRFGGTAQSTSDEHSHRLTQARTSLPPRHQRRGRRGRALQGGRRSLRGAGRPREARSLRPARPQLAAVQRTCPGAPGFDGLGQGGDSDGIQFEFGGTGFSDLFERPGLSASCARTSALPDGSWTNGPAAGFGARARRADAEEPTIFHLSYGTVF